MKNKEFYLFKFALFLGFTFLTVLPSYCEDPEDELVSYLKDEVCRKAMGDEYSQDFRIDESGHEVEMRLTSELTPFILPKNNYALQKINRVYGLKLQTLDDWLALSVQLRNDVQRDLFRREFQEFQEKGQANRKTNFVLQQAHDLPSRYWRFEASVSVRGKPIAFQALVNVCVEQTAKITEIHLMQNEVSGPEVVEAIWHFQEEHGLPLTSQHMHQILPVPDEWTLPQTLPKRAAMVLALWWKLLKVERLLHMMSIVELGGVGGLQYKAKVVGRRYKYFYAPLDSSMFFRLSASFRILRWQSQTRIMSLVSVRLPHFQIRNGRVYVSYGPYRKPYTYGYEHRYLRPGRRKKSLILAEAITKILNEKLNPDDYKQVFSFLRRADIKFSSVSFLGPGFRADLEAFDNRYGDPAPPKDGKTFLEADIGPGQVEQAENLMRLALMTSPVKSLDETLGYFGWLSNAQVDNMHEEHTTLMDAHLEYYFHRHLDDQSQFPLPIAWYAHLRPDALLYRLDQSDGKIFRLDVTHHYLFHRWADHDELFADDVSGDVRMRLAFLQWRAINKLGIAGVAYHALTVNERDAEFEAFKQEIHRITRDFLLESTLYERTLRQFGIDPDEFARAL